MITREPIEFRDHQPGALLATRGYGFRQLRPIAVFAGLNFGEYFSAWILAGGEAVMNAQHRGRFVAYYRVSTDRQGRSGLRLEVQRKAVMDYLNGGPWELAGESRVHWARKL